MPCRTRLPPSRPRWNRVPDKVRAEVIDLALQEDGAFGPGAGLPLHR